MSDGMFKMIVTELNIDALKLMALFERHGLFNIWCIDLGFFVDLAPEILCEVNQHAISE